MIEAATLRLRPILMTTGAMVLGALPLALAKGAGAEARQPIGWVIVGGLALGTVFTLFVIPTAYLRPLGQAPRGRRRPAMPLLQNDTALVTGAARGIGQAIARAIEEEGAKGSGG